MACRPLTIPQNLNAHLRIKRRKKCGHKYKKGRTPQQHELLSMNASWIKWHCAAVGAAPDNAAYVLLVVEHVIVILRPCAGRAGPGGADEAEHRSHQSMIYQKRPPVAHYRGPDQPQVQRFLLRRRLPNALLQIVSIHNRNDLDLGIQV